MENVNLMEVDKGMADLRWIGRAIADCRDTGRRTGDVVVVAGIVVAAVALAMVIAGRVIDSPVGAGRVVGFDVDFDMQRIVELVRGRMGLLYTRFERTTGPLDHSHFGIPRVRPMHQQRGTPHSS